MRSTILKHVVAFLVLIAMSACDRLVYSQRVDVPFGAPPAVKGGDTVQIEDVVIGRIKALNEGVDGYHVLIDVKPYVLPNRAAFLATTDATGRACLLVYAVPATARASRGPYWGARNAAELAAQLGQEQAARTWAQSSEWLLRHLGAAPPTTR